jgi:SAM-dependent methyltransferase
VARVACPCGSDEARVVLDTRAAFARRYRLLECARCHLRRPDVEPDAQALDAYYEGYGRYADPAWLREELVRREPAARRLLGKLRRYLAPRPVTGRFLEVGCASGALLSQLQALSSLECHGVEIDSASVEAAKQRLPGRVFHGQLADAGFPDGHFVAAMLDQVIEHVPDTGALLAELHRVLAPGGVLFVGTPNFRGVAARLLGTHWKELLPSDHIRMFSPPSLRWHLEHAGFEPLTVYTAGLALVRRDRKNLLPLRAGGIPARLVSLGLRALRLGDGLVGVARKP